MTLKNQQRTNVVSLSYYNYTVTQVHNTCIVKTNKICKDTAKYANLTDTDINNKTHTQNRTFINVQNVKKH